MNCAFFRHELRDNALSTAIWTAAVSFFMMLCVLIFPQMADQMEQVGDVFASMGSFTAAFGMDRLNFGSFIGFYAVECGNILILGGAMFAAILGITLLSKEEDQHTAEFLFSQPVSRPAIVGSKLAAGIVQILVFNIVVFLMVILSAMLISEPIPWKNLLLLHSSALCLQTELLCLCFGISAFLKKNSIGVGLGLTIALYFMQLMANITEDVSCLSYFTPFGYTDGATIITEQALDGTLLLIGAAVSVISVGIAFFQFRRKDLAA